MPALQHEHEHGHFISCGKASRKRCQVAIFSMENPTAMRPGFQTRSVGNVLKKLIADMGIGAKLDEVRALETWSDLAGDRINRQTDKTWIKDSKLYVRVSSSVWRHELHLQRSQWLERLNEALGKSVVSEIIFR